VSQRATLRKDDIGRVATHDERSAFRAVRVPAAGGDGVIVLREDVYRRALQAATEELRSYQIRKRALDEQH
jgi:hypothetical protein